MKLNTLTCREGRGRDGATFRPPSLSSYINIYMCVCVCVVYMSALTGPCYQLGLDSNNFSRLVDTHTHTRIVRYMYTFIHLMCSLLLNIFISAFSSPASAGQMMTKVYRHHTRCFAILKYTHFFVSIHEQLCTLSESSIHF